MCVLHVTSESSSFKEFLEETKLPVYRSYEKGQVLPRRKRKVSEYFGFSCTVSDKEWDDLDGQIEDAIEFFGKYETEIITLRQRHSVDDIRLDFPYECRHDDIISVQCDFLPPELLAMVGKLNVGIELSLYPGTAKVSVIKRFLLKLKECLC